MIIGKDRDIKFLCRSQSVNTEHYINCEIPRSSPGAMSLPSPKKNSPLFSGRENHGLLIGNADFHPRSFSHEPEVNPSLEDR